MDWKNNRMNSTDKLDSHTPMMQQYNHYTAIN